MCHPTSLRRNGSVAEGTTKEIFLTSSLPLYLLIPALKVVRASSWLTSLLGAIPLHHNPFGLNSHQGVASAFFLLVDLSQSHYLWPLRTEYFRCSKTWLLKAVHHVLHYHSEWSTSTSRCVHISTSQSHVKASAKLDTSCHASRCTSVSLSRVNYMWYPLHGHHPIFQSIVWAEVSQI